MVYLNNLLLYLRPHDSLPMTNYILLLLETQTDSHSVAGTLVKPLCVISLVKYICKSRLKIGTKLFKLFQDISSCSPVTPYRKMVLDLIQSLKFGDLGEWG